MAGSDPLARARIREYERQVETNILLSSIRKATGDGWAANRSMIPS